MQQFSNDAATASFDTKVYIHSKVVFSFKPIKGEVSMQAVISGQSVVDTDPIFENLKGWMRPKDVAEVFGISVWTIYTWKYKGKLLGVPDGLFVKFGRGLYIRTDVLRRWISSQNQEV